eukprot:3914706-Ditylum_brightwellii.AAC.1
MHFIILTYVLSIAVVPLLYESYNPACGFCVPATIWKCSIKDENDGCTLATLVRGKIRIDYLMRILSVALLLIALIFCTVAMVWVYLHVKRQEVRTQRYHFRGSAQEKFRESKRIRKILFFYTLSLYIAFGPFVFLSFVPLPFSGWYIYRTLIPLMGFWNMLVYFLPNCLKYQRDHPGTWLVTAYLQVLRPFAPCTLSVSGMFCGQKEDVEDAPEMNFSKYNTTHELTVPSNENTEP